MKLKLVFLLFIMSSCYMGCNNPGGESISQSTADNFSDPLLVAASTYPMKYFTQRIGGGEVDVIYRVPSDEDPVFWAPTPSDIRAMQKADLIIFNGAEYEKWATSVTMPASKVIKTAEAFSDKWLELPAVQAHSHGPAGEHSHEGTDFNTWLDPLWAIEQAAAIRDALSAKRPDCISLFQENFALLQSDLLTLHERLENATSPLTDLPLLASHPVYGYFADRYNLIIVSVLWEPDTIPSDSEWSQLDELLRTHPATIMIWEGKPDSAIESRLGERGIISCVVNPVGNTPDNADYLEAWNANAERLESAAR